MGLFNRLGRRVGEFEQQARAAAEGDEKWACTACETRLEAAHEECPSCGAGTDSVVAVED